MVELRRVTDPHYPYGFKSSYNDIVCCHSKRGVHVSKCVYNHIAIINVFTHSMPTLIGVGDEQTTPPKEAVLSSNLTNESHWMLPMLVGPVHYCSGPPAPVGVGGLLLPG